MQMQVITQLVGRVPSVLRQRGVEVDLTLETQNSSFYGDAASLSVATSGYIRTENPIRIRSGEWRGCGADANVRWYIMICSVLYTGRRTRQQAYLYTKAKDRRGALLMTASKPTPPLGQFRA